MMALSLEKRCIRLALYAIAIMTSCHGVSEPQSAATTPSALESDTKPTQILGDNFVDPPTETVPTEPGPQPAVCIGADEVTGVTEPFGNESADESLSLDWALTDFQPQSCAFESTYGLESFQGQVTLLVLLASW